ncbi:MAG: response regulator transcription factor [Pseudomonadota bacterium]
MTLTLTPRVLLVDDDAALVDLLRDYLQQDGFAVDCTGDAESATGMVLSGGYDMVVLDVMLPRMSGIEALRQIRSRSDVPVLMLTARGDDADRIVGLELGADDYVAKPCSPRELAARIRAILKRMSSTFNDKQADITAGDLTIEPRKRAAALNGTPLKLTSSEYGLLELLAYRAGQAVTKEELSVAVLGRPLGQYERSIDVHISKLRQKMGSHADGRSRIQSITRVGYLLVAE